jgi:integrase
MGRIFQRGETWWIAYYQAGVEHRESSESSKRPVAVKLLKKRHEEMGKGRLAEDAEKVKLSDLRALIGADYNLNGRRSVKRLGQSWAHLDAFFGKDEPAVSIKSHRLALYVTGRTDEGAKLATVKNELAALKRAFNLARKGGDLLPNEIPAFPTITASSPRQGFFELEEHEAVRAALPPDEGDVAHFLYWTGWRKSEALGLRWSTVNLGAGVLRIETSKNGEPRTLPYRALPELAALIEKRRTISDTVQRKRGMVVTHVFTRNGEPIRHFRRSWLTACQKTGVNRIPHDYRRSAARNLSRAGVPEKVIMDLCGWKTRSVFDRYNVVNEADLAAGLARLAAAPPVAQPSKVASLENTDRTRTNAHAAEAGSRRKSL